MNPTLLRVKMTESHLPKRFRSSRFDGSEPDACRELVENFRDHYVTDQRPLDEYPPKEKIGRGVLLSGAPGTGKTHAAVASIIRYLELTPLDAMYTTYVDHLQSLRTQMDSGLSDDLARRLWIRTQRVEAAPLLVLDDVGKEYEVKGKEEFQQWGAVELDRLLRHRFDDALPTILTTNISSQNFGDKYNPSMGSFIHEAFTIVKKVGKDWRE